MHKLISTGRVAFLPHSRYDFDGGGVTHIVNGNRIDVHADIVVNGTHTNVRTPKNSTRQFTAGNGVVVVPPHDLPILASQIYNNYTVIGSGKTGMDTIIWLLDQGVHGDNIFWVCPSEAWLINRDAPISLASKYQGILDAGSIEDVWYNWESSGRVLRIDESRAPSVCRYAVVSREEIDKLRSVAHKVYLGRVLNISDDSLVLENGTVRMPSHTLYIDCTASANGSLNPVGEVFQVGRICLQSLLYNPLWCVSASCIGVVETMALSIAEKNALCPTLKLEDKLDTQLKMTANGRVIKDMSTHRRLRNWMKRNRLNFSSHIPRLETIRNAWVKLQMQGNAEAKIDAMLNSQRTQP
jgi:hypothetical protein